MQSYIFCFLKNTSWHINAYKCDDAGGIAPDLFPSYVCLEPHS